MQKTKKPPIKQIIAVASGKGGVGKSTTAVNLALSLLGQGHKVGVLDADIYGPNVPQLLDTSDKPDILPDNRFAPVIARGLQTISMGYLIEQDKTPMAWRGPMATGALMQLFGQTAWDTLDYLIIDLPPGTGDIQLTLAQKIPVDGAVIVTTPHPLAVLDVQKAISLFQKVKVPILGLIENMASYRCSHCGESANLFGATGGQDLATALDIAWLGSLPLDKRLAELTAIDNYDDITERVLAELATKPKNYQSLFSNIKTERSN